MQPGLPGRAAGEGAPASDPSPRRNPCRPLGATPPAGLPLERDANAPKPATRGADGVRQVGIVAGATKPLVHLEPPNRPAAVADGILPPHRLAVADRQRRPAELVRPRDVGLALDAQDVEHHERVAVAVDRQRRVHQGGLDDGSFFGRRWRPRQRRGRPQDAREKQDMSKHGFTSSKGSRPYQLPSPDPTVLSSRRTPERSDDPWLLNYSTK